MSVHIYPYIEKTEKSIRKSARYRGVEKRRVYRNETDGSRCRQKSRNGINAGIRKREIQQVGRCR